LGLPNNALPVIVIGDQIHSNEDIFALEDELRATLDELLTSAETPIPTATDAPEPVQTPVPTNTATDATIHVAYVEKDGCDVCARASVVLEVIGAEYPAMQVQRFNNVADAEVIEAMGAHLDLPQSQRLVAPSVYVGSDVLVGEEITSDNLRAVIGHYQKDGAPAFWNDLSVEAGKASILQRFSSMGPLAVVVAALIDGVNPCAFATILFFVSYLAVTQRPRREMLLIGLSFTLGVFVAYLLMGLGAMSLMRLANQVHGLSIVLYGIMALGCFVLAGISINDYILARQGRLHDMRLNLPDALRERIKGRIRAASGAFIGAALVSGLLVSLLELACTGQVYLPTISFVVGLPGMRGAAILYLVLYNLVFVLPLLAVLLLAVYGVSATRFQEWFIKHAATSKLVMAVLFLLLGALLASQVLG
jgi:cytochrome c biogenesis protein CcdA